MMKTFVADREPVNAAEFAELALGTPLELWLGTDSESAEERAARLDAARDILADDPAMVDRVSHAAVEAIEAIVPQLLNVVPLHRPTATAVRRRGRGAVA